MKCGLVPTFSFWASTFTALAKTDLIFVGYVCGGTVLSLNLISDPWIPVVVKDGTRRIIAPWQIAEGDAIRPDWPRADLNLACLELLIGLVYLADPPADLEDWHNRRRPDADRLRGRLLAYASAFNLLGDGPLFLQDLEPLEAEPNPPDMLFFDSPGAQTARKNADLMVHRHRYVVLDHALAAMALYAFQAQAPAGGGGNRTSMRGGGPLITLVDPGRGLWDLVWANVPDGKPGEIKELPWMRPMRVSNEGIVTHPEKGTAFGPEAFFGMPRRLRLLADGSGVTGVIQRPFGTSYVGWVHPLTPYYRIKSGEKLLAVHPRVGRFGYRHWLGVLAESTDGLRQQATCLTTWQSRDCKAQVSVIVGGWAMDNMKPRDFSVSVQPHVALSGGRLTVLQGMILAAEQVATALRVALEPVLGVGELRESERDAFFLNTEEGFLLCLEDLKADDAPDMVARKWFAYLRTIALKQFDDLALAGLVQAQAASVAKVVKARGYLIRTFKGYGKIGGELYSQLGIERPVKKGKAA